MDFVVFGSGFGALLMLVGFALRDLGPWVFGAASADEALPEFETIKTTIRKQTLATIGNGLSVAGAGIAIVTFAALLSGADDRMGAMVVGISLILATIGFVAWSYDAYRRYQAAMGMVLNQERVARSRRSGRTRKPRPAPAQSEMISTESAAADGVAIEQADDQPIDESVEPEPADLVTVSAADEQADSHSASDAEVPAITDPIADEPSAEFDDDRFPYGQHAETADDEDEEDDVWPDLGPWRQESVQSPLVADDALIGETTRFDTPVPAWLFDDLDTDLGQSPSAARDPLDQFSGVTPVSRGSALERLLADDESGDDTDDPADPAHKNNKPKS